jgi:hypothetical protein
MIGEGPNKLLENGRVMPTKEQNERSERNLHHHTLDENNYCDECGWSDRRISSNSDRRKELRATFGRRHTDECNKSTCIHRQDEDRRER